MKRPLIKLFATPKGTYFYDANKSEMVPISNESYDYLKELEWGEEGKCTEELELLEQEGYLGDEGNVKEVRHSYSDYLGLFLNRKLQKITLQLTQNCNFRCKYCIYSESANKNQRSHSEELMSWEVAKQAIDFLQEHSIDSEEINIGFYGGEPLLEFGLLKQVTEYCEEQFEGKELSFSTTTNGTLLTEEIIQYFIEHNVQLMISLDGPKEINDENRIFADGSGTYDKVMDKIELIQTRYKEYGEKMMISMVMNPENDFDHINALCTDCKTVNFNATFVDKEYDNEELEFSEKYVEKYEYQKFLAMLEHFGRDTEAGASPIAKQEIVGILEGMDKIELSSELREVDAPSGPCIPGQLRLFCNVEGNLYPCERVSEKSIAMQIGTLKNGFDMERAQKILNVGNLTQEQCMKCWAFRFCNLCAKTADIGEEELSGKMRMSHCQQTRNSVYSKMKDVLLFQEVQNFFGDNLRHRREKFETKK